MRTTRRAPVLVAILAAMFLSAMEATVVATVMPTVVAELRGIDLYAWVSAAYLLATAASIPLWGRGADLFGRKPMLFAGMALFVGASVGCGLANSLAALVAFRAVQGVGAGALQPVTLTLIGDLYSVEERSRVQGLFSGVWATAAMAGPLVGGAITRAASWRWVFLLNLPFGAASAALLALFLHEPARDPSRRVSLDVAGAALLVVAVVSLLLGVGGQAPAFLLPLSLASTVGFLAWERRAPDPILPLSLFESPVIAVASVASALMGAVMMTSLTWLPLYAQALLGASPTEAGAVVAPMLLGWPAAAMLSARLLARLGPRPLVRTGLALVFVSALAVRAALGAGAGAWAMRAAMFAMGAGMGVCNTAIVIAVQESVDWARRGVATASTVFFRTIGGTVAVGAFGALVSARLAGAVPESVLRELVGPEHGRGLAAATLAGASAHLREAVATVFTGVAAIGVGVAASGAAFPKPAEARDTTG
ncbi:MAG: MDR family MFS transporter [Polyangiales bacterium]